MHTHSSECAHVAPARCFASLSDQALVLPGSWLRSLSGLLKSQSPVDLPQFSEVLAVALSADASCLRRRFVAPKIGSCKSLCRRAAGTLLEMCKTLTICGSPVQSLVMCIGRMRGQITEATGNDCPCPAQAGRMTCLVPFRRTAGSWCRLQLRLSSPCLDPYTDLPSHPHYVQPVEPQRQQSAASTPV